MHQNTIFRQLLVNIIIPILVSLIILAIINYTHTKNILVDSYTEKNTVIYDELRNLAHFQDVTLGLLEKELDQEMKEYSEKISEVYLADSVSIFNTDLYKLRKELGMDPEFEDLYIINRKGIVIRTTYKKDLYLNFFDFGEEHKNYLLNILKNNEFVSERFAIENATKRLRKYTYQPIASNSFILELGVYSPKADQVTEQIKERMLDIARKHERIKSVDMFIGPDNPFSLNRDVKIKESHKQILTTVFQDKENKTVLDEEGGKQLHYEYVYLERKNTDLYKSMIIRIVSDREYEKLFLRNELLKIFVLFGITIIVLVVLVYKKTQSITSPIEKLLDSIDIITKGDLNNRAPEIGTIETAKLSQHFNKMLDKIEERALENQEQNEEIQAQSEQLSLVNKELEKLSIVASRTDNGVAIFNEDGELEWINEGFEKIFGYSYTEIVFNIGSHISDFNENPDIDLLVNICLKTKQSIDFETQATTRSGNKIWVQTTLTPILNEANEVHKFVAIDSNITALKKVEEKLRQKNVDITDSINYAKNIQEAILPDVQILKTAFQDSFVFFRPKGIVSGDFYWFTKQKNKIAFASVDCTGHGIPGALIGMLGMAFLNEIVSKNVIATGGYLSFKANQILNLLRDYIVNSFKNKSKDQETKDGMDIALCVLDLDTYKMDFAGAYNPLYLIRQGDLLEYRADKNPIGQSDKDKVSFTNTEIQVEVGDMIYLFTDGFVDQFGGVRGKKFLSKKFKSLLLEISHKSVDDQYGILDDTLTKWKGDMEQVDDVLIMGIRIPPQKRVATSGSIYKWENKSILIAEDKEFNFKLLQRILAKTNAQVTWADNGAKAVDLVKTGAVTPDLILMDLHMPMMSGFEAIEAIKKIHKDIPIVVQTAFTHSNDKLKAFDAGCDDYIQKPINSKELYATLSKYLNS